MGHFSPESPGQFCVEINNCAEQPILDAADDTAAHVAFRKRIYTCIAQLRINLSC